MGIKQCQSCLARLQNANVALLAISQTQYHTIELTLLMESLE